MQTVPTLSAQQAQAIANLLLSDALPDRFTADQPSLVEAIWHVPIILAYPGIGSIGQVGEVLINSVSESVIAHTSFDEVKATGLELYKARQDEIRSMIGAMSEVYTQWK